MKSEHDGNTNKDDLKSSEDKADYEEESREEFEKEKPATFRNPFNFIIKSILPWNYSDEKIEQSKRLMDKKNK